MSTSTQKQAKPSAGVEPIAYRVPSGTAHAMRIKRYQDAASFGGDKKKLHEAAEKFGWKPLFAAPVSAEPVGYVSKQAIGRFQDGRHADIYPSIEELAHEFFDATPMALYAAPVAAQAQPPAGWEWKLCPVGLSAETFAAAQAQLEKGCKRSHPHENMSPECEALTKAARVANQAAQAQPLPGSLIPSAPDLEYLRGATENTALPAFLRGQIAAAGHCENCDAAQDCHPEDLRALLAERAALRDALAGVLVDDLLPLLPAEYIAKVRAVLAQQDADKADADPLQGAAEWLVNGCGVTSISKLARSLSIGYNRANRLLEAARKEAGQ
ncbi:hypothetical protein [Alcaligenes sp. Marseille-Q7550]